MRISKRVSDARYLEVDLKKGFLEGKNVCFSEKGVAARPGICPTDFLFTPWEFADGYTEFTLTDLIVSIDGTKKQIAVCMEDDGYSNIHYHIFALSAEGRQSLGTVSFSRAGSDSFFAPASFIIFDGKPTVGSGIYFFARLVSDGEADYHRVLELSKDKTSWIVLPQDAFYIPTLLINGRGELAAKALGEGVRLSAEIAPESLNLMSAKYRAGFTADGYSYSFKMPRYPLVGEIKCELPLPSGSTVSWVIPSGEVFSEAVIIDDVPYKLRVMREEGTIITDGEKLCTPLPFFGSENNLLFTLTVDNSATLPKACSFTKSCKTFASAESESGAVTVFSGSSLDPSLIVWSSPLCPLYFPEKNSFSVANAVTDLKSVGDRLLIFERYSITSAKASVRAALSEDTLPQIGLLSSKMQELSSAIIPETIVKKEEKLLFCTHSGRVYSVDSGLGLTPLAVCEGITPEMGALLDDKYLLSAGERAFMLDPGLGEFFEWELPLSVLSAASTSGKTVFYAKDGDGGIFGFTFEGKEDEFYRTERGNTELVTKPIEATFTAELASSPRCGKLHELSVGGMSCGITELLSEGKPLARFRGSAHRLFPALLFHSLNARFSFSGGAELSKAMLKYSNFNKL